MASKRYSLILVLGAALLFVATVASNVVLDPELVFGSNLFPQTPNSNERAGRLRAYKQEAAAVDSLLFSSSRGNLLDQKLLAKNMHVDHLFSLSVSYGMITDHLPIFEYILRDKAARGQQIKAVTLLLDADFFGKPAWTNASITAFLPPELTGDPPLGYWWRYLTAFQPRLWRDVIRAELIRKEQAAKNAAQPDPVQVIPAVARAPMPIAIESYRRSWNSVRPDLDRQLRLLKRFATLCRDNNVRLFVAVSPMVRQNLDMHEPGFIDAVTRQLAGVVPLWDFNAPPMPVADLREHWMDFSHFDSTTGTLMINRMFGADMPAAFANFGQMRGPDLQTRR